MDKREWYQVDNVANVFLATVNKRDTRSLRISCTLTRDIDPELLQEAVGEALLQRPQFHVRIQSGFFWHYMEEAVSSPVVAEESGRICPLLYDPRDGRSLHFKVSYYKNRINLDLFHAISDGTGAIEFLNIIVLDYLRRLHPQELKNTVITSGADSFDLYENSFRQFYESNKEAPESAGKSYHPRGLKLPFGQLQFLEVQLSLSAVLARSKALKVSLTSYLGAQLMLAFMQDMPRSMKKMPISIDMPVNLRNYYPSNSIRNFFNNITISHVPEGNETLEQLAAEYDAIFKENLTPEKIKLHMNHYQDLQNKTAVRVVPLFIKQKALRFFAWRNNRGTSAIMSNLGIMKVPEEMKPYIDYYSGFCSSQNLFMTLFTYGDRLVLGISNPYVNTGILKNFIRSLTDDAIPVRVYSTEVIQ